MKHAFLFGSSAFIVPANSISYNEGDSQKNFLKINSVQRDDQAGSFLDVDINIKDTDGSPVVILNNKTATGAPYSIKTDAISIEVARLDGTTILHVQQLDEDSAMALEHNIVAELEVQAPVNVIRVYGEFFVDNLHIRAENEKLFINENGYATSAMVGHGNLKFTSEGVVL
jgi:hypothetical protein